MHFLPLQLTTLCICSFAVVVKRGLFLVFKMFQVPLLSIKSPIFRDLVITIQWLGSRLLRWSGKEVRSSQLPGCEMMGCFPTARHWSGHWRPGGRRCDSSDMLPQVSTNSAPSVLLPASDLLYDSLISLKPLQSPLQVSNLIAFLCHKNQEPGYPNRKSKVRLSLLRARTHTCMHTHLCAHILPYIILLHGTNYQNQDSSIILNVWQVKEECCFDSDFLYSQTGLDWIKVALSQKLTYFHQSCFGCKIGKLLIKAKTAFLIWKSLVNIEFYIWKLFGDPQMEPSCLIHEN